LEGVYLAREQPGADGEVDVVPSLHQRDVQGGANGEAAGRGPVGSRPYDTTGKDDQEDRGVPDGVDLDRNPEQLAVDLASSSLLSNMGLRALVEVQAKMSAASSMGSCVDAKGASC